MSEPVATAEQVPGAHGRAQDKIRSYLAGLGLAALLTLCSFGAAASHLVWSPAIPVLLAVLAIAQMGVHLVFFLHISSAPDATNTILALAFGVFVTALVVFGSLLIMWNLDTHMVTPEELLRMQR